VTKKLCLVGFATRIAPGTMYQLLFAFMVTLVHMLFMSIYQPYRALDNGRAKSWNHSSPNSSNLSPEDLQVQLLVCSVADYFTLACNFSLTTVFFFCVFLKLSILTEAVDSVMTASLRPIPSLP